MLFAACDNKTLSSEDYALMLGRMFPGKTFKVAGSSYINDLGESYFLDKQFEGSFTAKGAKETLVVFKRDPAQLAHAQGFYNGYAAVFDKKLALLTPVLELTADEGHLELFRGKDVQFLFYAGSVTYQGWTEWNGGLWKAAKNAGWTRTWPGDPEFWTNRAVETGTDQIKVFERKLLSHEAGAIPEYTWEYAFTLKWNAGVESFDEIP